MQKDARGEKLISLEIARFAAALIVTLEHLASIGANAGMGKRLLTAPAPAAVLFFFALSGFVIYNAHWQDAGQVSRLPRYLWRRFWRIYPLYWLALVPVLLLLWPACSHRYLQEVFTLVPITPANFQEIDPPAWSLRYELTFYIMFGLALLPYLRRVLLPGWFLLLAWRWYAAPLGLGHPAGWMLATTGPAVHLFSSFDFMFFMGLAAGWLFVRHLPPARWRWPLLGASLAALLLLMLGLAAGGHHYPLAAFMPLTGAAFAAVIYALGALEQSGQLRLHRRWAMLGAMSYPLYLLHASIGFRFSVHFFNVPAAKHYFTNLSLFLTILGLSLVSAFLAAFLFDAPLQRLARKIIR